MTDSSASVRRDRGALVLSLDFELHWGIRDHTPLARSAARMARTREVIPRLLDLFREYEVACTWATVGLLFAERADEVHASLPTVRPGYAEPELDPYPELATLADESSDPHRLAGSLVEAIRATPRQELGTHTFSHYYALAAGQDADAFSADMRAARDIAARRGIQVESLVMPRNQVNPRYDDVLREVGILAIRTNPEHWATRAREKENLPQRAVRYLDSLLPVSGDLTQPWPRLGSDAPIEVPASAFFRPFGPGLRKDLHERRVFEIMNTAAERGRIAHLWWHPHNLGAEDTDAELARVRRMLAHYAALRSRHGMQSLTMGEVARSALRPS